MRERERTLACVGARQVDAPDLAKRRQQVLDLAWAHAGRDARQVDEAGRLGVLAAGQRAREEVCGEGRLGEEGALVVFLLFVLSLLRWLVPVPARLLVDVDLLVRALNDRLLILLLCALMVVFVEEGGEAVVVVVERLLRGRGLRRCRLGGERGALLLERGLGCGLGAGRRHAVSPGHGSSRCIRAARR